MVLEGRLGVAAVLGQGDPQLHPVQHRRGVGGDLRVLNPPTGGHQVQLARVHRGMHSGAVAVLNSAGEQPADSLEPGMWVRRHAHSPRDGHVVGAVVIEKAPGSDHAPVALRERAAHQHRPRSAQGHIAGGEDLDRRVSLRQGLVSPSERLADQFLWLGLKIAHAGSLTTDAAREPCDEELCRAGTDCQDEGHDFGDATPTICGLPAGPVEERPGGYPGGRRRDQCF